MLCTKDALRLGALALLASAGNASAQSGGSPPKTPLEWAARAREAHSAANPMTRVDVVETEPNNTIATSSAVSLGDNASGLINPVGDLDFYAVTVTAGTVLVVEVSAAGQGSALDSELFLVSPGGTVLAVNDNALGMDSRIRFPIPATGRYFVAIRDIRLRGGAAFTYSLTFRAAAAAPGDPTTVFASRLGRAWAAAAGPGVLYVSDWAGRRILRVAPDGQSTVFATGLGDVYDLTIDGFGNLLVVGEDATGRGYAARFLPNGQRSDFATGLLSPMSITIGPDGDVWIADHDADLVRRFSPRGVAKGTVSIAGTNLFLIDLAFSPAGVLHLANFNDAVYKVVNGQLERVITSAFLGSMAFDRVGNLYVGTGNRGIMMYDANYKLVHSPFAEAGLNLTGNIVFSRDAAGAMTARLFGVNLEEGVIREVNPAGVSAPGFRIGADLLVIAVDSVRRATMGAGYADTLRVSGVAAGVSWTISSGVLPRGITLSSGGELTGVPAESGSFPFEVRATSSGRIGVQPLTLTVARPSVDAAAASNQLLGVTGALSPELEKFLDLQGNANGRYDVGDLRAWLQGRAALKPLTTRK